MSRDRETGPKQSKSSPPNETSAETVGGGAVHFGFPRKIGQYTIKRVIAGGGMGTVLEGMQEHPRRPVAIKVMKAGFTSPTALRRFEYESQILARMSHPGIAQVYESGTHTDHGREVPYFAMEYLPNARPITEFADDRKLGTRKRLELFVKVCEAVHYGHQKGIIHRDLKPGNILVDSHGQPRVIDFGVARATDSDMAVATQQTEVGQLLGTIQYMSPEQCQADPHDIDIRSDVYALGVVLYRLLCGKLPYKIGSAGFPEAARVIREYPPTRPSDSSLTLRGDPETILLRALEKDRDRRYQSALALAEDIRRYLVGEAIVARPPSFAYQLRVFARRNKTLLGAVATVFVVLIGSVILSTSLFLQARDNRIRAEQEAKKSEAAVNYLVNMVTSANPIAVGPEVQVSELLRNYADNINEAFSGQPEVEASLRSTIGLTYRHLNLFEKGGRSEEYIQAAMDQLEKALEIRRDTLGEDHPDTLESIENLAMFLTEQGRLFEAEPLKRQVLEVRRRINGPDHPDTLATMYGLADLLDDGGKSAEAEAVSLETLKLRRTALGVEDPFTLQSLDQYASLILKRGSLEEAEALKRQVYDTDRHLFGDGAFRTWKARSQLGVALLTRGKITEAEKLFGDKQLPEDLGVIKWLNGGTEVDPKRAQVLVFWESWCPYSYKALPELQEIHTEYGDRGLQVIGLTRLTKGSTEEQMRQVIRERKVSWPTAWENGDAWDYFELNSGIPAAVALRKGKVVWEGHPTYLTRDMVEVLVAGLE